jgi:hypothetical protein
MRFYKDKYSIIYLNLINQTLSNSNLIGYKKQINYVINNNFINFKSDIIGNVTFVEKYYILFNTLYSLLYQHILKRGRVLFVNSNEFFSKFLYKLLNKTTHY